VLVAQIGDQVLALEMTQCELQERSLSEHVSAMSFAWAHAGLGESDRTFEWLGRLLEELNIPVLK
jgi:hypothetical protein